MLRGSNQVRVFSCLVCRLDPNSLESGNRSLRGKKTRAQQWGKGGTQWHVEDPPPLGHQGGDSFPFRFQHPFTWPDCFAAEPSKTKQNNFMRSKSFLQLTQFIPSCIGSFSVCPWLKEKWDSYNFLPRKASDTWKPSPRVSLLIPGWFSFFLLDFVFWFPVVIMAGI